MEVTIVDFQFFSGMGKTTVSLLSLAVIGLCSPTAIAQEEFPTVQRLKEITIPQGTVEQLEETEPRNSDNFFFGVGGSLSDDADDETFYLDLDYGREARRYPPSLDDPDSYYLFGRKLIVRTHFDDWLTLNHGEGPRGYVALPIILF